ncbi:hypothetical protein [Magnetospirillum aberrantis]|uniref:Uncharacterized protein n=1 Tax=Magnetospirillum aberrantis SpK TaxID=908842 RepID=A0A7C9UW50_9PROT|nr:hypothetical protein [Magnetospirillum aberrantis]NFV79872.1 hypothetical protein [Magnetospirillum aberrantis SpK]
MPSFEYPNRRSSAAHQVDIDLVSALEKMLENNQSISLRSVISQLDGIGQPSSISRDEWRNSILQSYQHRQREVRALMERADKTSKANVLGQLQKAKKRISELEAQVEALTASHKALIQAVGQVGGMSAWKAFYDRYQTVVDDLNRQAASPMAEVVPLRAADECV